MVFIEFINHLIIFTFLIFIQVIKSNKNIKTKTIRILQSVSQITITIKGKGNQYILNDKNITYNKNGYIFNNIPDQIIVNGKPKNYTGIMVYDLEQEENVITMKFNNLLTNCNAMFGYLNNITRIDLSKFDSSKVTVMAVMFYECNSLTSIYFKNFKTSSVNNIEQMFLGCNKLTSIDLSSFDTSSVTKMAGLFFSCSSLLSLDLKNFNTSLVNDMTSMFQNCHLLKILNLQNFNTSSLLKLHGFFKNCNSLLSVNLKSFDTSSVVNMNDMFLGCQSLISLDISHFDTSSITGVHDTFKNTNNKTIYCINNETTPKLINLLKEANPNYTNNCNDICFTGTNIKLIPEKKTCIQGCFSDNYYILEYDNICYETCPNHTHISSNINACENDNSIINWNIYNFFDGEFQTNDMTTEEKDIIIKNIKDDIINNNIDLTNVLSGDKTDLIFSDDNTLFQITSSDNQKNNEYKDISTIQLGKCETILKSIYKIDPDTPLVIFKVEHYIPGVLIPVIGYDIFHPINKTKLDLKYCNDSIIDFKIPVSINEDELFKYDPNSEYYTDECYSYTTDSGTDIVLEDRQEEYNNENYSLCENNCNFSEYSQETKKTLCICGIKSKEFIISEMINDDNILSRVNFTSNTSSTNMVSMTCIYTVFTKEGLVKNVGNYALLIIFVGFITLAILFYKIGYEMLNIEIDNMIKKNKKHNKKNSEIDVYSVNNKKRKKSKIFNPNIKKTRKKFTNNNNKKKIDSILPLRNENSIKLNLKKQCKKTKNKHTIHEYYDCEMNSFSYKNALKYDKRTFYQYYISLIKAKHPITFSFVPIKDYNSQLVKISLFLLLFSINYIMNALFFNESAIHRIYLDKGEYNYGYFIPKLFLYFLLSHIIYTPNKYIALSERNIIEIKNNCNNLKIIRKNKNYLVIKYICYFSIGLLFIFFLGIIYLLFVLFIKIVKHSLLQIQ